MPVLPLDLSRPLELNDGSPVVLVRKYDSGEFEARTLRYVRGGPDVETTWGYRADGTWSGGNREIYYYVRNAAPAEPEEYEGWFVD